MLEGAGLEGDTSGATDATVVPAKLERLLPKSLRRRAVATATATHVLTSGLEPVDARLHGLLVDTAAHRDIVYFSHSDGDGRVCDRQVQPLICFIREGRSYRLGHDLHRRGWRVFRLDRISSAAADPAVTGRSPPRKLATVSIGLTVAESPMRCTGAPVTISNRSKLSAKCVPRLVPATACTSSTMTVSTPRRVPAALDVSMR